MVPDFGGETVAFCSNPKHKNIRPARLLVNEKRNSHELLNTIFL